MGLKMIKPEMQKFKEECITKFHADNQMSWDRSDGDWETMWKFDNEETCESFTVTSDHDNREGKSRSRFTLGKNKTGIFQGIIHQEVPKDGEQKSSGYANMRSPLNFKSFKRSVPYNWEHYNHLVIRCRGDGRPFTICIGMDRYYDINWNDQYNFPLYTRGGPYWQTTKIPFSKFIVSSKGHIQDKQGTFMGQLDSIRNVGITIGDGATGPFRLEIDFIACMFDGSHKSEFDYELYKCSPTVHC